MSLFRSLAASVVAAPLFSGVLGGIAAQPEPYSKPRPVRPNLPGPLSEEVGLTQAPPLAREGSFVTAARGQALKGKSGRWFFVFDPDARGYALPPMVLLPNLNLAATERLAERSPPGTRMLITGQVLVYEGLNYLLATAPPLLVRLEEQPSPAPLSSSPETTSTRTEPPNGARAGDQADAGAPVRSVSGEPEIEEIVARLDKAAGRVAATSPRRITSAEQAAAEVATGAAAAASGGTDTRGSIAPGILAARRGRILRAADGAMVFHFDSGTSDGAAGPLVLLPCQNLSAIEQVAERSGEGATYTVTGEVQTYRGRSYLLVRSYKVNRATDQIMPAQ